MRRKTKWYLAMGILGVALSVVSLLLGGRISDNVGGMLTGVGMGLFGFGFSQFKMRRWEEKDPQQMRKAEIEANDERNVPSAAGPRPSAGKCCSGRCWRQPGCPLPLAHRCG